jgi:hypothetical protein
MSRRRAVIGLCAICALLVSAYAAQSAAAATKGTTLFTCSSSAAVKDFKSEHCVPGESGTGFGHTAVAEKTTTQFTASNEKTDAETKGSTLWKLKTTLAGSATETVATGAHLTGTLENVKEASGEHTVVGREIVLNFTGVTENLLGCVVTGNPGGVGNIKTNKLIATTMNQGDAIKFTPESGTVITEYGLSKGAESCPWSEISTKLVGSFVCKPSGATINCSHSEITAAKTLRCGTAVGPLVGLEGKVTVTGGTEKEGKTTPLSVTTVETA